MTAFVRRLERGYRPTTSPVLRVSRRRRRVIEPDTMVASGLWRVLAVITAVVIAVIAGNRAAGQLADGSTFVDCIEGYQEVPPEALGTIEVTVQDAHDYNGEGYAVMAVDRFERQQGF